MRDGGAILPAFRLGRVGIRPKADDFRAVVPNFLPAIPDFLPPSFPISNPPFSLSCPRYSRPLPPVIPAKAGIQRRARARLRTICQNQDFQDLRDFRFARLALFGITENLVRTNSDELLPTKDEPAES